MPGDRGALLPSNQMRVAMRFRRGPCKTQPEVADFIRDAFRKDFA